jgi:hypothetical protein
MRDTPTTRTSPVTMTTNVKDCPNARGRRSALLESRSVVDSKRSPPTAQTSGRVARTQPCRRAWYSRLGRAVSPSARSGGPHGPGPNPPCAGAATTSPKCLRNSRWTLIGAKNGSCLRQGTRPGGGPRRASWLAPDLDTCMRTVQLKCSCVRRRNSASAFAD